MSLPSLLIHTCQHYAANTTKNKSGGIARYYDFVATIACNFQTDTSTDNEQFKQRREAETGTVFFADSTAFDAIGISDLLVFNHMN